MKLHELYERRDDSVEIDDAELDLELSQDQDTEAQVELDQELGNEISDNTERVKASVLRVQRDQQASTNPTLVLNGLFHLSQGKVIRGPEAAAVGPMAAMLIDILKNPASVSLLRRAAELSRRS